MAIENENKLNEVIKAFADAGFIDDVVLIGSWCLGFYAEIFEGFTPSVIQIADTAYLDYFRIEY